MAAPDSGAVDRGRPGPGDRAPRRRAAAPRHSSIGERLIAGVPARVIRPITQQDAIANIFPELY